MKMSNLSKQSRHVPPVPPSSVGPFLFQRGQTNPANGSQCPNPAGSSLALQFSEQLCSRTMAIPEVRGSLENRDQLLVAADPQRILLGQKPSKSVCGQSFY